MNKFYENEIPKEVIRSLVAHAYSRGVLQGMGEATGGRTYYSRMTTMEQIDDLIMEWFSIEGFNNLDEYKEQRL